MEIYHNCSILINGTYLGYDAKVIIDKIQDSKKIKTILKGYAGEETDPPFYFVKINNIDPSAEFEICPDKFINFNQLEITITNSNSNITFESSDITDNNFKDESDKLNFSFNSRYKL
jgi:hypothetical protein